MCSHLETSISNLRRSASLPAVEHGSTLPRVQFSVQLCIRSRFGLGIGSVLILSTYLCSPAAVQAYPEYQTFIEKNSGKTVNCAVCHTNGNGPAGNRPGQIGALSAKEMAALNAARAAMEPGMLKEDNPILNRFGNSIIRTIGKKKVLDFRSEPIKLADALGSKGDLDEDGIPDSQEYLDGTNPLSNLHGDPWKLFCINIDRLKFHLLAAAIACLLLDWGFAHLIRGFALTSKSRKAAANSAKDI